MKVGFLVRYRLRGGAFQAEGEEWMKGELAGLWNGYTWVMGQWQGGEWREGVSGGSEGAAAGAGGGVGGGGGGQGKGGTGG